MVSLPANQRFRREFTYFAEKKGAHRCNRRYFSSCLLRWGGKGTKGRLIVTAARLQGKPPCPVILHNIHYATFVIMAIPLWISLFLL